MDASRLGSTLEDVVDVRRRITEGTAGIERSLAVMSGKGGVGKTAVAVNLAVALAQRGARVGLLDADLNGPSVAKMLGLRGQPVRADADRLRPVPGPFGLVVQSMDFFLQGNQPLAWDEPEGEASVLLRGALEESALADLLGATRWGALDTLVVDLAPGAERLPALRALWPALGAALAVTIPTEVALLGVERSVRRAREVRVPLIGLVENLGSAVCARCGNEGPLFQEADVDRVARELDVELVARVPFDPRLAADADAGRPFVAGSHRDSPAGRALAGLAERVARWVPDASEGESW